MKISYRNYPALQIYDKRRCRAFAKESDYADILVWALREKDEATIKTAQSVAEGIKEEIASGDIAEYFSDKPIYYISPTFLAAVMHAIPQMNQLLVSYDVMKDIHEDCVMILPTSNNKTILEFSTSSDGTHRFTRSESGCLSEFYIYDIEKGGDDRAGFKMSCWLTMADNGNMAQASIEYLSAWYIFLLFKKYANVETYLIEAGQKQFMEVDFSPIDCKTPEHKAKNEAGIDVIVLDSLWYTTICREEGFMVSGHFRLQPKKINGKWTREIIYIAAYEKHGYHRQAKIRTIES